MLYLTLKTIHIIALVAWFAGLFYLPRLFVYHLQCVDNHSREMFCNMERKLYRYIMFPAATVTIIAGLYLMSVTRAVDTWIWLKLGVVGLLLVFHFMCGRYIQKFAQGEQVGSGRFFRLFNEIPTVLLILIVTLVVFKPF